MTWSVVHCLHSGWAAGERSGWDWEREDTLKKDALHVVLVDDHVLVRESIALMLSGRPPLRVAGQASRSSEALALLESIPCQVLITAIGLGERDSGISLIHRIRERRPTLPVLVLTRHREDETIFEALAAGANGYMVKSGTSEELLGAIEEVSGGGSFLHPSVSHSVLRGLRSHREMSSGGKETHQLSHRERELLTLLSRGMNNNQMALQLHLSLSTVKTHLRTAYRKLSATDRTQAVLRAMQLRLIPEIRSEVPVSLR